MDVAAGSPAVARPGFVTGPREKAVGNAATTTTTSARPSLHAGIRHGPPGEGRLTAFLERFTLGETPTSGASDRSPNTPSSVTEDGEGRVGLHANSLAAQARTGSVISEGLDPILIQVTIPLPMPMIYAAFTDPTQIKNWLADDAHVTAEVGGTYHLSWKGTTPFESPGKIVRMTPDLDIGFSWFAPPPFERLMNHPEPRTQVYVRLQESPEGIDITLEHEGWGASGPWEEARSWHFHFWEERLTRLKDYLIKTAYG